MIWGGGLLIELVVLLRGEDQGVGVIDVSVQVPDPGLGLRRPGKQVGQFGRLAVEHRRGCGTSPLEHRVEVRGDDQPRPQRPEGLRQGQVHIRGSADPEHVPHRIMKQGRTQVLGRPLRCLEQLIQFAVSAHHLRLLRLALRRQLVGQPFEQLFPRRKQAGFDGQTDSRSDEGDQAFVTGRLNEESRDVHGSSLPKASEKT